MGDSAFYPYFISFALKHILSFVGACKSRGALQSFTVRCAAVAARIEDPYIDTTMKVWAVTWSWNEMRELKCEVILSCHLNCSAYSSGQQYFCWNVCVRVRACRPAPLATWRCVHSGHSCSLVCALCVVLAIVSSCCPPLTQTRQKSLSGARSAEACTIKHKHVLYCVCVHTHTLLEPIDHSVD